MQTSCDTEIELKTLLRYRRISDICANIYNSTLSNRIVFYKSIYKSNVGTRINVADNHGDPERQQLPPAGLNPHIPLGQWHLFLLCFVMFYICFVPFYISFSFSLLSITFLISFAIKCS